MSNPSAMAKAAVVAALKDEKLTAGATVEISNGIIGGNLAYEDPEFSPVYADAVGRLWKETHTLDDGCRVVCILDMREAK